MNNDLTVGKPGTVLWRFCLPLFGSILFQQLYNIADSLVAGNFVGESALAAVGNSYEITLIFIAFAFGCNIGAYFSGILSGSLHAWLWLPAAFAGSALGVRLRPLFGLAVEKTPAASSC